MQVKKAVPVRLCKLAVDDRRDPMVACLPDRPRVAHHKADRFLAATPCGERLRQREAVDPRDRNMQRLQPRAGRVALGEVDPIEIETGIDFVEPLTDYFRRRERRRSR